MFFHKQTKEVEQVEKFVRSLSITIPAKYEDEIYKLYPTDIYYIETIDRRTYLYTASRVYESSENLLSLEKLLEAAGFIRVRKNCIINKYKLRSMMISKNDGGVLHGTMLAQGVGHERDSGAFLPDSHIEAVLGNDEHIVVTRSYIAGIKEAFAR